MAKIAWSGMMNCGEAAQYLPGYLDGTVQPRQHAGLSEHLFSCAACREQLDRYRQVAGYLAKLEPMLPPRDLALRIRVQASQIKANWLADWWTRASVSFKNIFEPLAVPATGGFLTALAVFVLVVQSILVGMPMGGVIANDPPLNLVQPAQLESLAPFPIPAIAADGHPDNSCLLLEATLNAQGQVVHYRIISGPNDAAVQKQIDQVLLFSKFRPELSFGVPMSGGRVLLSFNEVHVHG